MDGTPVNANAPPGFKSAWTALSHPGFGFRTCLCTVVRYDQPEQTGTPPDAARPTWDIQAKNDEEIHEQR